MNRQAVEDIIRHEFKKTKHTVSGIFWNTNRYEVEDGILETSDEVTIFLDEPFSWKKLYRRFSRLETKLNKKYGVSLDIA